jgi:hypothetical protein
MATNPNSYAELVSLYFEGALSGEEKLAVYNTLGVAEEARLEFEAALFLQRTLDRDTLASIPASVENDLFRRAGIVLPMEESAAPKRKQLRVAAIAFLLGALSVFSIERLWSDTNHDDRLSTLAKERLSSPVSAFVGPTLSRSIGEQAASLKERSDITKTTNVTGGTIPNSLVAESNSVAHEIPFDNSEWRTEMPTTVVSDALLVSQVEQPQVSVSEISPNVISEGTQVVSTKARSRFEVSVLHTNAPRYFPKRDASASSLLDNSSIAVRYQIASDHWLGIAAGSDVLPLEIMQGKSETIVSTLDWAGISYQLNIRSDKLPLLYPFIRETLGLTKFGLLAKTGLGVRFSPNEIIHAALGIEHTTMPVRTEDVMRGSGKLSLAYDITVQF